MPFLRPVPGASVSAAAVEIRSSKTLIGSGQSKCDVVLPAERGVLDLHALFNLSTGSSAATLVPFSATTEGACFLNGRVVPAQGANVVHGDKVAFGSADNAFVFTLTEPSTSHDDERASQNSRSFRRTLDALRGDRAPIISASQSISLPKKREPAAKPLAASGSRERLERFLLDASTDSLLGDYVERKLRASASSTSRPRRGHRPTAMEPPPSLSASTVSSLQSSLTDSILDRSALERARESSASVVMDTLEQSQSLLSTAERNYAEIEKLRLSQRLREVNNVLNGHLNFDSSYLMKERRSSGPGSMRFASPLKSSVKRSGAKADGAVDADNGSEEEEHDDDDDLPAMVEKRRPKGTSNLDTRASSTLQQKAQSVKSSIASLLGKSLTEEPLQPPAHEPNDEKDDDAEVALDDSLPSFSEAILKRQSIVKTPEPVAASTSQASHAMSFTPAPSAKERVRTQLHQQLIDRTLRQKRHEVLTEGFLRWRRGLRIQQQRRREKSQQQQLLAKRLTLLRRNQMYTQWKKWAERKQQVRQCREEALTQRQQTRLVRTMWAQWRVSTVHRRQRRHILRRFVVALANSRLRSGFQMWKRQVSATTAELQQREARETHRRVLERRMEHVAVRHHELRVENAAKTRIFRAWRTMAMQSRQKKRGLHRMLQLVFRRHQLRAWTTWVYNTSMIRHAKEAEDRRHKHVEEARSTTEQQLQTQHANLKDQHQSQISSLQTKVDELQRQLRVHEQEKQDKRKQAAANRAQAKAWWNQSLEKLLEGCIAQADLQIADVNTQLESFLQQMDAEPEAARFQAATFLVDTMLQQKLRHVNERLRTQEVLLQAIESCQDGSYQSGKSRGGSAWKTAMTSNARYLLDMVHQRHARLHQLNHAVAKLAATVVDQSNNGGGVRTDTAKFKHAAFLTDTMNERATDHLDTLLDIHYRRCELGIVAIATETEAHREEREAREARKY